MFSTDVKFLVLYNFIVQLIQRINLSHPELRLQLLISLMYELQHAVLSEIENL